MNGKMIALLVCAIVVSLAGAFVFMSRTPNAGLPMEQITIGTTRIQVEVASTAAQQQQGLSGRTSLAQGNGMLFVFSQPGLYSFWMKDMQFPLDIVWAGEDGTINTIDSNLSPATYPTAFPPAAPSQYVLEVPAGFAATHGISIGQKIVLQ